MSSEYIIYAFYIIPLLLSLRSYQLTARVYEQLPDKLPMNFDFHGKVNAWWSKNSFSAYLLPHIGIFTTLIMCAVLYFIHNDTGPLPDDFALAFWFFNFSIVYLLYKSQQAILEYSLAYQKSIWPVINKGFLLLTLACTGLLSLMFINTEPEITAAVFSAKVEHKQAIDVREKFSLHEPKVFLFLNLHNIKGEHLIRTEWLDPQDNLYFNYQHKTHHKVLAKRLGLWFYINIAERAIPGKWRTNIYINGIKVMSKEFTLTAK